MRHINTTDAITALSHAATNARNWAGNDTLSTHDREMIGRELSAIGAVQDEMGARALDLTTVIGMLAECEIALQQMANDANRGACCPYELSRDEVRRSVRRLRGELAKREACAAVDPMAGVRI